MNKYTFEEIHVGLEESFTVEITEESMSAFLGITGDVNPLHADEAYAKEKGFSSRVAYGMLTASYLSTLAGVYLPGERSLIYGVDIEFPKPVYIGDVLTVTGTVSSKDERFGMFVMDVVIKRENGQKVCRGKMKMGVLK